MKEFKAVLFDFDGVLAETMEDNFNAWKNAFSDYKIVIKREEYFVLEGLKVIDVAKTLLEKYKKDEDAEEIVRLKKQYYLENHDFKFYEGVEELVERLGQLGKKLAIVSASPKSRLEKTVPKKFLEKFEVIISGDDCERGKPDPEPYLNAMESLNAIPEECIVVENAPLGIKSAKKAGVYCVAIESTLDSDFLKEADETFCSIKEFTLKYKK